ncbi:hypothetical protein MMC25_000844 [Agyrium rufum]|nr:hypothetical protein [Agyrium rufum]
MDFDSSASMEHASTTTTTSTSSGGVKRKRNTEPKFYAVRVGHRPGIYHTYAECLEQVKGFKNATFKSFPNLTDAEHFVAGANPSKAPGSGQYKFYAVKSGRQPGIYTSWPEAQKQIKGWSKPRHQKFSTRAEAQRFLDGSEVSNADGEEDAQHDGWIDENEVGGHYMGEFIQQPAAKKTKKPGKTSKSTKLEIPEYNEDDFEAGLGPFPPGVEDEFDPNILLNGFTGTVRYKTQAEREATKIQPVPPGSEHMIRIYTDGSSLRNGQKGAYAGVGVYFGPKDKRNLSESLPGPRQTNQRAELTAILRALETVPRDRDVTIVTDSQYSINCATVWYVQWRKRGWKNAAGKPVENRDIIENILNKIEDRTSLSSQTNFEWIKGHANHPGNEAADKLAVAGARNAASLPPAGDAP